LGIQVQEGPVTLEDLKDASEVFITGSNKKVMPVTQVDEQIFNQGIPGPIYQALAEAFPGPIYQALAEAFEEKSRC
jgi:branched-subunit amino acid aminotransferase/4-amino-4-deoxychorismate lyase